MRKQVLAIATVAACVSAALMAPAIAQFWNPFGSGPDRQPPRRQQQQAPSFNPFGGLFGGQPVPDRQQRPRPAPTDYSSAPPPARRGPDAAAVTSPILVLGDSMADWLAHGLEDAFSEKPEFGVLRRHRGSSGLVRYDPRRDVEWPQVAREAIAAERPKFIVMMVGFHDRQPIRDRVASPKSAAPKGATPARPAEDQYDDPDSPESRARASADQQNAEMRKAEHDKVEREKVEREKAELQTDAPPDSAAPGEQPRPSASGPMEFQSEAWEAAYIRRIDATMAALKSAGVPVLWVGLPPQRNARPAADAVYLNELYRARAERAGVVFVDIWDSFVDETGRYVVQGPDFEGQIRRLRSGDGIYFTRAGARKLAHYVEREILRSLTTHETPIALPAPEPATPQPVKPGAIVRPVAGPVIPLTASFGGGKELLGGGAAPSAGIDALANRVLVKGDPITAPAGRADNFAWPRGSAVTIEEPEPEPTSAVALPQESSPVQQPAAVQPEQPTQPTPPSPRPQQTQQPPAATKAAPPRARPQPNGEAKQAPARRAPTPPPPRASNDSAPRPPLGIPFFR